MVMKVFAIGDGVTVSIVFQAAVNRAHNLLQTLDSITHVPHRALTHTLILQGMRLCVDN